MAICSTFRFLEGGEPPLLLLSLFHKLPATILNIQNQKVTEPWRNFNLWQMVWSAGSDFLLAVNEKRAHTTRLLETGHV